MKSNCLIFAIAHWLKFGGYIIFRKSHYGWWFHVIWSKDFKSFEEFHPIRSKQKRLLPPVLFRGYVKHTQVSGQHEKAEKE